LQNILNKNIINQLGFKGTSLVGEEYYMQMMHLSSIPLIQVSNVILPIIQQL